MCSSSRPEVRSPVMAINPQVWSNPASKAGAPWSPRNLSGNHQDKPNLWGSKPGASVPRAGVSSLPAGGDATVSITMANPPHSQPHPCLAAQGLVPVPTLARCSHRRVLSACSMRHLPASYPTSVEAKPLREENTGTSLGPTHLLSAELSAPQHQGRHASCPKSPVTMGILPFPGPRAQAG